MGAILLAATVLVAILADAATRPRRPRGRSLSGTLLCAATAIVLFGGWLAIAGSAPVAAVVSAALLVALTAASNAKHAVLGEPLVFSDFALVAALFRHPRFYFGAVPRRQRITATLAVPVLLVVLALLFVPLVLPHLAGMALVAAGVGAIALLVARAMRTGLAATPDLEADVARHGLVATLLLYRRRWRMSPDPVPCAPIARGVRTPRLVIVVQCESFADPVTLTQRPGDPLPGLAAARARAFAWGDLTVSGFGAYTMRTEYGVLFGRDEAALGFRRYDPYLTAGGETSYALPMRLRGLGYRATFVHPHDLGFYGRDRLLPAAGFDTLVGLEHFPAPPQGAGIYVDDGTLGGVLEDLAAAADGPTLFYAVTMENHGPWDAAPVADGPTNLDAYLSHLRSSDTMLAALMARLDTLGRSALLVFFGDHRPSIPGATAPDGARHTPYVMVRFGGDGAAPGDRAAAQPLDLTPAQLHHAILDEIAG